MARTSTRLRIPARLHARGRNGTSSRSFSSSSTCRGSLELVGTDPARARRRVPFVLPLLDAARPSRGRRVRFLAPVLAGAVGVVLLTFLSMSADAKDAVFQRGREGRNERAEAAIMLAGEGIPPEGPLDMLRRVPLHARRRTCTRRRAASATS